MCGDLYLLEILPFNLLPKQEILIKHFINGVYYNYEQYLILVLNVIRREII